MLLTLPTPSRGRLLGRGLSSQRHCLATCRLSSPGLVIHSAVNAGKKEKGLTLEEVETAEGGVVRESAVGMAQTKRAARRKGKQAAAAGAPSNVACLLWPYSTPDDGG